MMSRVPLTERQVEVLRWIADGCPERDWPNSGHKNTAVALQSRRLAAVTKRGGIWTARITDAGKHYLAVGQYPADHWPHAERSGEVPAPEPAPVLPPHEQALSTDAPSSGKRAEAMLDRLVAANGSLKYDERTEGLSAHELTRLSQHAPNLPAGKKLSCERTGGWPSSTYNLRFVDDFAAAVDERPVPVPLRIAHRHPTTAAYVSDTDRHEVSRDSFTRAERIVEALARESASRGYRLTPVQSGRLTDGQVQAEIDGFEYPLRLRETSGPGGRSIDYQERYRGKLPAWQAKRQRLFVPTGRLELSLAYPREGRKARFADNSSRTLEERLPALLREVEIRAREDARQRELAIEKAAERRRRWESAMDAARVAHGEAQLVQALEQQLHKYDQVRVVQDYIAAVRAEVDAGAVPADCVADVNAWMTWIDEYARRVNPVTQHPTMPSVMEPSLLDLQPYLGRGWSVWGPDA